MLLEEGHCLREQALAVCGSVKPVAMASYGATSLTTLLQMVSHGMGVTLVPEMAADAAGEMRDLKIVPFAEPMPERTICLAWRRNRARQEECLELAAIIRQLHRPQLHRKRRSDRIDQRRVGRAALLQRPHKAGLRAQDHPVGQDLQMIGAQRRACRGDVDDDVGRAGGRRAFGGAEAFDDAVDLDAVLAREELLGQPPVFGGDAQTAAMALAELGGDVVEVGHGVDVEPGFRHGDHDIGRAEAEPRLDRGLALPVGDVLAQQILAGDAEVDAALADLA